MNTAAPPRNRRVLYLLLVLFFGPLAASFALYYGSAWRPGSRTNHGELYVPARPLATGLGAFRDDWSIVYVGDARCDADCREALVFARQVRLGLNQEMKRVRRVFLATDHCCDNPYFTEEHAGMVVIDAREAGGPKLLDVFPESERANALFVVDPLGNLVLRYDARQEPKGFLSDLKKLLKLSHIG